MTPAKTDSPTVDGRWTMRTASRRLAEILRDEGVADAWFKLLGETVYRRLVLLERSCSDVPTLTADVPVEISRLTARDLPDCAELEKDADAAGLAARLAHGHHGFGARLDGCLVHVAWVARGRLDSRYLDLQLALAPDEACTYATFTAPSARGVGIAPAVRAHTLRELGRTGCGRLLATILPENRAGLRMVEKLGYRRIGLVGYFGAGSLRRGFCLVRAGRVPLVRRATRSGRGPLARR